MGELTSTGYKIKTANEWFEEEKKRYEAIDPKWNLDASTPDGLKLATDSEIWATLDELAQQAYNSKDPSKATGIDLDALAYISTGSPRKVGTASTATMEYVGTAGTIVNKGSLFKSTVDGTQWSSNAAVTLVDLNEGDPNPNTVLATCLTLGAINANVGDITNIVSPIAGLTSATNSSEAIPGTNQETDAQLRERRQKSVATVGNNQVDNIYSAIASLDNVSEVKIYENYSNDVDTNGVDAHSIGIIVNGSAPDDEIALAIYGKKNPGCGLSTMGSQNVTKTVTSPVTGNQLDITFNSPEGVPIYIVIAITTDGNLPGNISTEISNAIISYAAGQTEYTQGFRTTGFRIGDDVLLSNLYTPVNQILGKYGQSFVTSLTISDVSKEAATAANIEIDAFELATFNSGNMNISVT